MADDEFLLYRYRKLEADIEAMLLLKRTPKLVKLEERTSEAQARLDVVLQNETTRVRKVLELERRERELQQNVETLETKQAALAETYAQLRVEHEREEVKLAAVRAKLGVVLA